MFDASLSPPPSLSFGWTLYFWGCIAQDGLSVLCSHNSTMRLWETATGNLQRTFLCGPSVTVLSCSYSPDGRLVLCGSLAGDLQLFNAATGDMTFQLTGRRASPPSPSSGEGRLPLLLSSMASSSSSSSSSTPTPPTPTRGEGGGHDGGVYSVAFSPDGRSVVTASSDTVLKLWSVVEWDKKQLRLETALTGHTNGVCCCAFVNDPYKAIVSSSWDKTIKVWLV